ncbi:MAG: homoserine O-acetyltransferase [Porticoccaceae bacterium]|nr:homoserine O-acetyltransferase [Porticoccaceae bacterium]
MSPDCSLSSSPDNLLGTTVPQTAAINRPMDLVCGATLPSHSLVFETHGSLNKARSNAILICHALSGDHHVAGINTKGKVGWWDHYIGPGKAIDTTKFFVVCPNNIGSCFGSTGPTSNNPRTGKVYGDSFPSIQVRDWVESQKYLMDHLKIECWAAVIGGSLGGMQAMCWSLAYPDKLKHAVVIAAAMKLSAQNIAFNEIARRAIQSDIEFKEGHYLDYETSPTQGLALARMIGHLTYLSDDALHRKFGRLVHSGDLDTTEKELSEFEVASYLNYQGDKFSQRFDANSYILITKMLDHFDLSQNYNDNPAKVFVHAQCQFLVVSFSSDWRFSPLCSEQITDSLVSAGKAVSYIKIETDQGHDAFLLPNSRYQKAVSLYLSRVSNELEEISL